jgi:hypothetical protein
VRSAETRTVPPLEVRGMAGRNSEGWNAGGGEKRLVGPLLKVPFALRTDLVRTGGRHRCSCFELPHAVVHVRLRHVNVFHNRTQIAVPENRHELRQFHAPFDRARGEGVPLMPLAA